MSCTQNKGSTPTQLCFSPLQTAKSPSLPSPTNTPPVLAPGEMLPFAAGLPLLTMLSAGCGWLGNSALGSSWTATSAPTSNRVSRARSRRHLAPRSSRTGCVGVSDGDFGCQPLVAHLLGHLAALSEPQAALLQPRASLPSPPDQEEPVLFCQDHPVLLQSTSCPRQSPCQPLRGTKQSAPVFAARAGESRQLVEGFPNPIKIQGSISSSTAGASQGDQTPSRPPCAPGDVPRPWVWMVVREHGRFPGQFPVPPDEGKRGGYVPISAGGCWLLAGLSAGTARDLRALQALTISCIWRKPATASTSSTLSGFRLSLAVYMNSKTWPRPAREAMQPEISSHLSAIQF